MRVGVQVGVRMVDKQVVQVVEEDQELLELCLQAVVVEEMPNCRSAGLVVVPASSSSATWHKNHFSNCPLFSKSSHKYLKKR
jgi:hypothetical protein